MLIDILLLGVAVAFLRGGRPDRTLSLAHSWLILVAAVLQAAAAFTPQGVAQWLVLGSYGSLLVCLVKNLNRQSIRLIFVGVLLNVVVILANGGRMPVSLEAAGRLSYDLQPLIKGTDFKRVAMSDATAFNFLGDVIYVPIPIPRVVSIGDVAIALGAFLLIQEYMLKPLTFQARRLSV